MAKSSESTTKYQRQQRRGTTPHIPLESARAIAGLTIDALIDRIEIATGHRYSRGAISNVEKGTRGASVQMLEDIAAAYKIPVSKIRTDYLPRTQARRAS